MSDAKTVIKKITDVVTIVCPAIVSVAGIFSATVAHYMSTVAEVLTIALGAAASIASVIYNAVAKEKKDE